MCISYCAVDEAYYHPCDTRQQHATPVSRSSAHEGRCDDMRSNGREARLLGLLGRATKDSEEAERSTNARKADLKVEHDKEQPVFIPAECAGRR